MGRPDAEGVTGTVERAVHAEAAGYERFWVAEHHAVPGIASGTPAVLLAAVGAATRTIRIGSGGVMLPNHQPLVVAEQFLVLEALHPGRVDLGVGRSLGFTEPVRKALRHDVDAPDTFEADLQELGDLLAGTAAVTARPASASGVPMSLLATGAGVAIAARLGLPLVVGGPMLWTAQGIESLEAYRRSFVPGRFAAEPHVTVSLDVLVADDDVTARELALPEAWAMATARRTGEFPPLESVEAIRAQPWTDQVRRRVESQLDQAVVGSSSTVQKALEELRSRTGADELMASSSTHDREALFRSDTLLRDLLS